MAEAQPIKTNFTAGELSPRLYGRVDVSKYFNGAKTLENFIVLPHGGITARPGTRFKAEVKDSSKPVRLVPFEFSEDQSYVLEMGDEYMRFFAQDGAVLEAAKVITAATNANPCQITSNGHSFDDGDEILIEAVAGMTELNDKRYLVANSAANTFTLTDKDGDAINSTDFTAYVSGGTAKRVYEISTPWDEEEVFELQFGQSADVMNFTHSSFSPRKLSRTANTSWTLAVTAFNRWPTLAANATTGTLDPSADAGAGITVDASVDTFVETDVGGFWRIKDGYVEIKTYVNAKEVTADVQVSPTTGAAGDLNTGPAATTDWSAAAWSATNGYPAAFSYFEQRAFYAGSTLEPQTIWGSVSGDFENFDPGAAAAADSVAYTISTDQINGIRWLNAGNFLACGTIGGEFKISSGNDDDAITPTNIKISRETTYGS